MSEAHHRTKQPEAVREALLACAERLLLEKGGASLTIQAVAEAAGVTKGGLLHHYPSRQVLLNALCGKLLGELEVRIEAAMAADPRRHGRFTRAYVDAVVEAGGVGPSDPRMALWTVMFAEAGLRDLWAAWLNGQLARHRDTDAGPDLALVRYVADGIWLIDLVAADQVSQEDRARFRARLVAMTQEQN